MMLKWGRRLGLGLLGLIALFITAGASYQFISTKWDEQRYPPPGEMVDMGGYRLHLHSMGTGGPTVILEAGLGNIGLDWGLVQPEIAKFTRVVSYDRAGSGWSEKGRGPRTSARIVRELHALLEKANIPGPYIMVGHSFGGATVQLFAATFPDEVAGLVLVDSCHEAQEQRLPENPFAKEWMYNPWVARISSLLGVHRLSMLGYWERAPLPRALWDTHMALCLTTKHWCTMTDEGNALGLSFHQLEEADQSQSNLKPCVVITAGKVLDLAAYGIDSEQEGYIREMFPVWLDLQKELVGKFPQGRQVIAEKSDHMIPWHQPELIVEVVQELVAQSH